MSDPATDLVFDAVTRMKANRARIHTSLDVLTRLQATAAPAGEKAVPPREPTPPPRIAPTPITTSAPTPRASTPPAGPAGSKAAKLATFREPVLACTRCPHLVSSRTQVVFGVGNPDAELMFIGEAPGADEDLVGEPFVGKAGQLLTKIIETMGFRRSEIYIANILKCRPDMPADASGNRKPTASEMETCKPYLLEQIKIIQPRVLVALGATALEGLIGGPVAITKLRGTWKEFQGIPLMPTLHPAYLLRNQSLSEKRKVWEDMLSVLERLGREITPKQHGYFLSK
jgi:uracil-DNA glycosylase family 4